MYDDTVPCGLVARIRRSHRRGRGSIPRTGAYTIAISKDVEASKEPVECQRWNHRDSLVRENNEAMLGSGVRK